MKEETFETFITIKLLYFQSPFDMMILLKKLLLFSLFLLRKF
jgi:hypothetical protein